MRIDWWTLGIQAVNVLILIWLLGHFFWKPVAAMIEQRRAAAQRMLAEVKAQQDQVAAALAKIERTRAGFALEREALLAQARAAADHASAARLAEAAKEAAAIAADAKTALDKEKMSADEAWRDLASRLALDIASRLCAPLAGATVQAVFLDRLLEKLHSLSETERRSLAAQGAALEAISPAPLAPADEARVRERIAEAFGGSPQLVFGTDPALIAGLELRGPHLVVSNSWRADLQRIRTDLAHDSA